MCWLKRPRWVLSICCFNRLLYFPSAWPLDKPYQFYLLHPHTERNFLLGICVFISNNNKSSSLIMSKRNNVIFIMLRLVSTILLPLKRQPQLGSNNKKYNNCVLKNIIFLCEYSKCWMRSIYSTFLRKKRKFFILSYENFIFQATRSALYCVLLFCIRQNARLSIYRRCYCLPYARTLIPLCLFLVRIHLFIA